MHTTWLNTTAGIATLTLALALLAGCGGDADEGAASTTTKGTDGAAGEERIPDGRYVRQAVSGLAQYGVSGVAIVVDDDRFKFYVTDTGGVQTRVSQGILEYDDEGNVLLMGGDTGCPDCPQAAGAEWKLDGSELTFSTTEDRIGWERMFALDEGIWLREDVSEDAVWDERIPDGRYVKLEDGSGPVDADGEPIDVGQPVDEPFGAAFEFDGDHYDFYLTNAEGIDEHSDSGTLEYDDFGNVLWVSESPECPGCAAVVQWVFHGPMLALEVGEVLDGATAEDWADVGGTYLVDE